MLPKLALNAKFIQSFINAETPCCAMGIIEERNKKYGLLALRLNEEIPNEVTAKGFNFGHSLLGTGSYEVLHFGFEFYGYETYNVIINPNNHIAQKVLDMMIENESYFILVLNPDNNVIVFKSEISETDLIGFKTNITRIKNSRTTSDEYLKAVLDFDENPEPEGELINWACHNNIEFLDLDKERIELNPS